jgi:hypothetical protein
MKADIPSAQGFSNKIDERVQVRLVIAAYVPPVEVTVELPVNVPMWQLVPALVSKLGAPAADNYLLEHENSGVSLRDESTLYSANVCHGDTLRLLPYIIAGGMTIRNFRDLQIIDMYMNRKQLESEPYYALYALFLYTSADSLISRFMRDSFAELSKMSGKFQFYVVEQPDEKWLPLMRQELTEKLGPHIERVWKILEASEFHPVDVADVYDIAARMGVTFGQIPCAVFFTRLDSHQVLIVPFESLVGYQAAKPDKALLISVFRQLYDQINTVVHLPENERLPMLKTELEHSNKAQKPYGEALNRLALATITETVKVVISEAVSVLLR